MRLRRAAPRSGARRPGRHRAGVPRPYSANKARRTRVAAPPSRRALRRRARRASTPDGDRGPGEQRRAERVARLDLDAVGEDAQRQRRLDQQHGRRADAGRRCRRRRRSRSPPRRRGAARPPRSRPAAPGAARPRRRARRADPTLPRAVAATSVGGGAAALDDRRHHRQLLLHEVAQVVGRAAHRLHELAGELLAHVGLRRARR